MGFYVTGIVGCIGGFINVFVNFFVIGRRKLIQIYLAVSLFSVSLALMFEAIGRSKCKFGDIKSVWTILNLSASFIGIAAVVALWFLLNFVIVELYAPQICLTAHSWLSTFGNIGGLLGPVYYSAFYYDVIIRLITVFWCQINALYQLYTIKFWLPFTFFIVTLATCLFLSIFIPETLGSEQLLELGEARRRSSVHFDSVSRRLSNVSKNTKRRMSAVSFSVPEKIAERLSKLNKENNAYTQI